MATASYNTIHPSHTASCLYTLVVVLCMWFFGLCVWNEARLVNSRRELYSVVADYSPVSCEASDYYNDKVIHIDCPLRNLYTFYPPSEFSWNVDPFDGVFFEVRVEMFQSYLKFRLLNIYNSKWVVSPIHSFFSLPSISRPPMKIPNYIPHVNGAGRHFAPEVYCGLFQLKPKHLTSFKKKKQLELKEDGYYYPSEERPPAFVDYTNTQLYKDALYTGDPGNPQLGDLRITFWGSAATHSSALAVQKQSSSGYFYIDDYRNNSIGKTVQSIVFEGDYSPNQILQAKLRETDTYVWVTWTLRTVTCLLAVIFFHYTPQICRTRLVGNPYRILLGALAIGPSSLLLVLSIVWAMVSFTVAIIMVGIALALLGIGIFTWFQVTQNGSAQYLVVNDHVELIPPHLRVGSPRANNKLTTNNSRAERYYQPI